MRAKKYLLSAFAAAFALGLLPETVIAGGGSPHTASLCDDYALGYADETPGDWYALYDWAYENCLNQQLQTTLHLIPPHIMPYTPPPDPGCRSSAQMEGHNQATFSASSRSSRCRARNR